MLQKTFSSPDTPSKNSIFNPILAPILAHRPTSAVIVGAAVLHAGLVGAGLPSWSCPFRDLLGIPCPGCGLSRAITALLQGDWQTSFTYHLFAPFFLLALILMAGVIFLPGVQQQWLVSRLMVIERRTGIVAIMLVGLVVYWLTRLIILREAFINLILG
jgi:hypothetical protein